MGFVWISRKSRKNAFSKNKFIPENLEQKPYLLPTETQSPGSLLSEDPSVGASAVTRTKIKQNTERINTREAKSKRKKAIRGRKGSCQSGQQDGSYQSDKRKRHFQSGIKLSISGCNNGVGAETFLPRQCWSCGQPSARTLCPPRGPCPCRRGQLAVFPEDKDTTSQLDPRERDTEDGGLQVPWSGGAGWGGPGLPPQSPSASESANLSSHLTSKGRSRRGPSSSLCESSGSVGSRLARVSCSVS